MSKLALDTRGIIIFILQFASLACGLHFHNYLKITLI